MLDGKHDADLALESIESDGPRSQACEYLVPNGVDSVARTADPGE